MVYYFGLYGSLFVTGKVNGGRNNMFRINFMKMFVNDVITPLHIA